MPEQGGGTAADHRYDHLWHCDELGPEVDRFALRYEEAGGDREIPSCPGWTADDLAGHLGLIHRWAEHLVRVLAPSRISARTMGLDTGPPTPQWIRAGGEQLVRTLRGAGPEEPMWAWGADQHVRFWSRRQLHETLVHRLDLDLAVGRAPEVEAPVAIDAVDELLGNLSAAAAFSPDVTELRGSGTLRFQASDQAGWSVTLKPDGFDVSPHSPFADVEVESTPTLLLLVLYRRCPRRTPGVAVRGDTSLLDFWLDHSALQ